MFFVVLVAAFSLLAVTGSWLTVGQAYAAVVVLIGLRLLAFCVARTY